MTMAGGDVPTCASETEILGVSALPARVCGVADLAGIGLPVGSGWHRAVAAYLSLWRPSTRRRAAIAETVGDNR
jgi:hypothetical protein